MPIRGERLAALEHDERHVGQRLDVVDDGRLAEQADLDRERRLVARLAALALDRFEERRLLAADVRAGAAPELDVEGEARAEDVRTEEAGGARRTDRPRSRAPPPPGTRRGCRGSPSRRRWRSAAMVIASTVANGSPSSRTRSLNVPGLRLVGVADEVVRLGGLGRDGGPLATGRERGTAAAHQLRGGDLRDDRIRADLDGARQGAVAAARPVGIERGRVDRPDPAQEPRGRVRASGSRSCASRGPRAPRGARSASSAAATPTASTGASVNASAASPADRDHGPPARGRTGPRHGLRSQVARPSRIGSPAGPRARVEVRAQLFRAGQPAGDVVADVGHHRRPRVRREERVEGRDAVRLGRRDGQPLADVVEGRRADPADPRLDGVQGRQELRAAGAGRVAAARGVPVDGRIARPADPARFGWAEHGVHGGALGRGGERPDDVEIHHGESSDPPPCGREGSCAWRGRDGERIVGGRASRRRLRTAVSSGLDRRSAAQETS